RCHNTSLRAMHSHYRHSANLQRTASHRRHDAHPPHAASHGSKIHQETTTRETSQPSAHFPPKRNHAPQLFRHKDVCRNAGTVSCHHQPNCTSIDIVTTTV